MTVFDLGTPSRWTVVATERYRSAYLDLPTMDDADNLRFVELETRVAYQERTIEDLNEVVLALRTDLESLRREIGKLEEKIDQGGPEVGPAHEPPPHW